MTRKNVVSRQSETFMLYVMAFDNNNTTNIPYKNPEMSTVKDEDSPKQQINEQSLTQDLEKNRESLKRKLQARRSMKQLVDVGIMPPPKAPLPFYEQRKQLQMRKTQDILKNKIISRPDRQLLIEHNILSDTTAAPAIQKTQCQLKRARLADNLNDKLAARPGVLELVANNILEIDPNLKEAIQGGRIKFPSTKSTSKQTTQIYSSTDQQPRPLRPKTSSFSNTINGQSSATTAKRSLISTSKVKSSLTFHEYKGPSQKVAITKVPVQPTPSLIVQPVQATLLPLVPLEHNNTLNENHYRIQLRQQQLFLELLHDDKQAENDDRNDNDDTNNDDNPIGNLLQQPIDDNVNLLSTISDEIQSFEKMKLADLKNECRKLNLSTTGTKIKLIEKLRNAKVNMSDTKIIPSQTMNNEPASTQLTNASTSSVTFIIIIMTHGNIEEKLVDDDAILSLLDDFSDTSSTLPLHPNDSLSHATNSYVSSSPTSHMDWLPMISSPTMTNDLYDDNNSDLTQFLNQFGNDHHLLFDTPLSTCQQQNVLSFDLLSPSSPMI
ncbi:unnamed protein product [Rotaria socialis]|uniref:SAP domain-containing protein n=1 Tax=Rotaria socialis TaxID=392032 RepID=A0A821NFR5_9BILA|nr:unnamed protein product [Rotaria socialis]